MPQVPDYITITDATGVPVAFLSPEADGITDCEISSELNGSCEITFRLPLNCEKVAEIIPERRIVAGGKEFVILSPASEERSREERKVWLRVTAPESPTLLAKQFPTIGNDHEPAPPWGTVSILASDLGQGGFPPGSAGSALYRLLQGSGWTVGTVDTSGSLTEMHDLETERLSLLENIKKVQETWGGYLVWDSLNKTISLRDQDAWQPGTGFEIRYAKNLKGVTREVDSDLVTRLYPFGEDSLSIASVNGGQLYIEDHHYSGAVYEGIYENQGIASPEELLAKAREALAELSEPRVSYQVDFTDLSSLPAHAHETFALGDVVRVIDPEMQIDARSRVVKYTYNVFQPWKASVEIGKPTESLAAMIADGRRASQFVDRVLRPNPGTGNLLRGFISTFATTINSANGKLVWDDSTLQAIEVDDQGNETGKRVRITPGGVGISADGGQTFTTAMTGQGILANAVIVSDLYALASDDGYTQLKGDGLHVFDPSQQERVHVGRWFIGAVEHYGIRIFANDGTVLLDDRGMLQTWEVPKWGNVDATHPLRVRFYLPPEVLEVKHILLRLYLDRFRAHSKSAASGGGTTSGPSSRSTTYSGGGDTSGASSRTTLSIAIGVLSDLTTAEPGVPHDHNVDFQHEHNMEHDHWIYSHTHDMDHTHDIDSHSHSLVFGIYEGAQATGVTVRVNGVDRTAALGGPFSSDRDSLDISPYVSVGSVNVVELGGNGLGLIDASVFIQVLLGV